jgi:hypothetical protein
MRWPPDDPADVRSDTPNRISGTLRIELESGDDSHDHLLDTEMVMHAAMYRQ